MTRACETMTRACETVTRACETVTRACEISFLNKLLFYIKNLINKMIKSCLEMQ
jgi:hypothetical protein